jgi:WhiB family redox-sensing transcriptional regulator
MSFVAGSAPAAPATPTCPDARPVTREVPLELRQVQMQVRVEEGHMEELLEIEEDGALGWQERALCAQTDPEAFFPEKGGSTREAKKVCLSCDVRGECLEYALSNDERFGIWGGLSERERRKLKKRA